MRSRIRYIRVCFAIAEVRSRIHAGEIFVVAAVSSHIPPVSGPNQQDGPGHRSVSQLDTTCLLFKFYYPV